jgi:ribosome-binding factor A
VPASGRRTSNPRHCGRDFGYDLDRARSATGIPARIRAHDMANPRTIARLEARIHERAAYCLQFEVSDPRASFITVTRVELSSDITSGKIFYSVLGTESDKSKADHMLKSAAGFIQRQVARVLDVRRMPHLRWVYDGSMEQASNMDKLIREAREHDRLVNPHAATELGSGATDAPLVGANASLSGAGQGDVLDGHLDAEALDDDPDLDSEGDLEQEELSEES